MKASAFFVVLAAIMFGGCTSSQFGSRQADNQVAVLEQEIRDTQKEVSGMESRLMPTFSTEIKSVQRDLDSSRSKMWDSAFAASPAGKTMAAHIAREEDRLVDLKKLSFAARNDSIIEKQIAVKRQKINDLRQNREAIVERYTESTSVPTEISSTELHDRQRSFVIRREEMVLRKVECNISSADMTLRNRDGYKVILDNQYGESIDFVISPVDGGENKSVVLDPQKRQTVYLLPGTYSVDFLSGGRFVGDRRIMHIDGILHIYKGEECFNFAYMSRY